MVKFTIRQKCLIVSAKGDIDSHNASSIREQIDLRISHEGIRKIIFDFSNLDFMDSSGIGIIIGRYKLMSAVGGEVCIVATKPTLKKLLCLSGVHRIINIYPSLEDAIKTSQRGGKIVEEQGRDKIS